MNLNKIVNEINGTVKKSKIRTCGYLGQTKVEQLREYPEIHLEDLLLALPDGIETFKDENIFYIRAVKNHKIERVEIDLIRKPLSKQKPEVIKKLIEILS